MIAMPVPKFWASVRADSRSPIRSERLDAAASAHGSTCHATTVELAEVRQAKAKTEECAAGSLQTRLVSMAKAIVVDVIAGLGAHAPAYDEFSDSLFARAGSKPRTDA